MSTNNKGAPPVEPDAKPWWTSRGEVGALVVILAQVALLFDWEVDTAATTEAVLSLVSLLGGLLAWWGRLKATRPISRKQVVPGVRVP